MSATSSIGPISGIDYGSLINGLISIDQQPIDDIATRLQKLDEQNTALLGMQAQMTALQVSAATFTNSSTFRSAAATVANPSILSATAGVGTPSGNYSFNVQRLASASQMVSQGFSDSTTALGMAGNLEVQLGGGRLDDVASLTTLNGGAGVARGSIRITDRSGASTLVDLSHAVDMNDVVNTINSSTGVNVTASIQDDHLVLADNSNGSGTLSVANSGGTSTASDLGLTVAATGGTLTGSSVTKLAGTTSLDSLNDGQGVRSAGILNDFSITGAGGAFSVSLTGAKTIADVVSAINTAGQSDGVTAAISADGSGLTLTDANHGPISVSALNGSLAAYDLGIQSSSSGGTLTGSRITSVLNGPLLTDLNGGNQGQSGEVLPQAGTITINGTTVDLSGATSLADVISGINSANTGVTAAIDQTGTGISLSSNSPTPFTVADGTGPGAGNLASFLHISGTSTATASGSAIASGDLHLRDASNNTQLSSLNGGAGVTKGSIRLSDGTGASMVLDLSGSDVQTLGDVIKKINGSGLALSARINDTGDGILLSQTAGTLAGSISDVGTSTMAAGLGISGTFANNQMNGSQQKTIAIIATDTLSTIAQKINNAGVGVAASVLNDGSGNNPFRLSLSSRNSGEAGRLIFDGSSGVTGGSLNMTTLVQGQDAVMVFGGNANGTGGLLSTSKTNTFTGLVPGMSVTLSGVGSTTVAVNADTSKITDAINTFVTNYNAVITNIASVTAFDTSNSSNTGVLFGDSTTEQLQDALGSFMTQNYTGVGQFNSLAAIGITVQQDGTLQLDSDTLNTALATDPDSVRELFTTNTKAVAGNLTTTPPTAPVNANQGIGATLTALVSQFTDSGTGLLFDESDSIQSQETQLKDRQTELAVMLIDKKNRLTEQFANLETTIAGLQSSSSAISSLSTTTSSSTTTKKS